MIGWRLGEDSMMERVVGGTLEGLKEVHEKAVGGITGMEDRD